MTDCVHCGTLIDSAFAFCPECGQRAPTQKQQQEHGEDIRQTPQQEQQQPLEQALSSLHDSIGLDDEQLEGLSAARDGEMKHSRLRRMPEPHAKTHRRKPVWHDPPLEHPVVWRPMGRVRPPPPAMRVSASEPAMRSSKLPQKDRSVKGSRIPPRVIPSVATTASGGKPSPRAQPPMEEGSEGGESAEQPAELTAAQQTAMATGGFRRGNVVFAPAGWADRAAEAAALAQMEVEMRERKSMMNADGEAMALKLEEMRDPMEALLARSVAPGRHQILSRALDVDGDALAVLVAFHIEGPDEWILEVEAYYIRNTESGENAPTGQPELAFALRLSMGETLAMVQDPISFIHPTKVRAPIRGIVYSQERGFF